EVALGQARELDGLVALGAAVPDHQLAALHDEERVALVALAEHGRARGQLARREPLGDALQRLWRETAQKRGAGEERDRGWLGGGGRVENGGVRTNGPGGGGAGAGAAPSRCGGARGRPRWAPAAGGERGALAPSRARPPARDQRPGGPPQREDEQGPADQV